MKRDPVCNMEVREENAVTAECNGEVFYFCSEGCRDKFLNERVCKVPRRSYDLIIVGAGPAGLTAGVYAATLRVDAFLIGKDLGGQAVDSTKIENYMGYDFIRGPELVEKFQYQLIHSHYIDHLIGEVDRVDAVEGGFNVITAELVHYFAKTVIVATGMTRRKLDVPGEETFQRRGVFYGNIQDFSFVHDSSVAVIGGGNSALQMAENLRAVAKEIHLVSLGELTGDPVIVERVKCFENLHIYEGFKVLEMVGDSSLSGITIRKTGEEETRNIPVRGAFISIGLQPNIFPVAHLVKSNDRGEIMIGPDCSTSCPGLFAAGDVTNAFGKRIIIASGEGAKAAMAARQYLLSSARECK